MPVKFKIKKGDKVIVIAGKDKGKQGDVLQIVTAENRAVVSGVNVAKRTTTAFITAPFFTRPRGMASLTDTTMMSPMVA